MKKFISGKTGNCTWTLKGTELTISGNGSGNGRMGCYYDDLDAPWGTGITKVTIEDGVGIIGAAAFALCADLKTVNIGRDVEIIGAGAFYGCTGIKRIDLPYGIKIINNSAFNFCFNLEILNIPNSVIKIGQKAISGCEKLKEITLPDSIETLEECGFGDTHHTKKIKYMGTAKQWANIYTDLCTDDKVFSPHFYYGMCLDNGHTFENDICSVCGQKRKGNFGFFGKWEIKGHELIISGDAAIPEYSISSPAPWGKYITKVTIENGITSVGDFAFYCCRDFLKEVNIGSGVTNIKTTAFSDCENLESINIDANNKSYSSEGGVIYNKTKTQIIYAPEGIKNCVIPNSVKSINSEAFYGCTRLTNVTIPNSVKSIGKFAFSGCTSLESIAIPNSVIKISTYAFYYCTRLTIRTPAGSYAEKYANKNNILFAAE